MGTPTLRRIYDELSGRSRRQELTELRHRIDAVVDQREPAANRLAALNRAAGRWRDAPVRDDRINQHLSSLLHRSAITGGRVLEIGGREHPRGSVFDNRRYRYTNLDLEPGPDTIVADITGCPEIADDSFE